jgi:hypothetical protein
MHRVSESPSIAASESGCSPLHHGAGSCPERGQRLLIGTAYLRWPRKTAAHLAHAARLSLRAAKYFLAGGESEKAVRAIIREEVE